MGRVPSWLTMRGLPWFANGKWRSAVDGPSEEEGRIGAGRNVLPVVRGSRVSTGTIFCAG